MSNWTPEPWKCGRKDMTTIIDGYDCKFIYAEGTKYVALAHGRDVDSIDELMANAQRIVDCVNACEGINPSVIPKMIKALEEAREQIRRFKNDPDMAILKYIDDVLSGNIEARGKDE